jgi:iron complex outermembrane receptor protein
MATSANQVLSVGIAFAAASAASWAQTSAPARTEALPRVTISASAPDPANEPAGVTEFDETPLAKTPASVGVVTARDLRESGVRSLSSMARGQPSVEDAYNTVGFIETLQVRGFVLDSVLNYRRNGLPVSNYAPVALENKDRIEILKGLDGAVAGTSSPGGLINYVTKRPAASSLREVNAELSERGTWNLGADVSERAGALGYRFTVATEERRPNARNAPGDRRFAAGAMDLKLPGDGIFEFEIEWQRARQISVPGFGLLARDGDMSGTILPPPIDPRINLNDQPWSLPFENRNVVGTAHLEQPLGATWRVGVRALAQRIVTNDRIAFPDGCSTQSVYPGLCSNYDVDIWDYRSNDERRTTRSSEAYAIARFDTAGIGQRVQFGARATRYAERLPPKQAYNNVGYTNVFAPRLLPADPTLTVFNTNRDLSLDELYAYDAVKFTPAWSAWVGARYVRVKSSSALTDGSESVAFSKNVVTPWAAVGWEPWGGGFLYASAGSGIEAEVVPNRPSDFVNPGEALPIGRSRSVEVGYKQALSQSGHLDLAIFEIRKPYSADILEPGACVANPNPNPNCALRVADGRIARHRGVEIALAQAFTRAFSMDVQATYLDARNVQSIDPTLTDKRVTNVPNVAASLGANLRPSEAIDLLWRNRVTYQGTKAVLRDNSVTLPASWQWDTVFVWVPAASQPRWQLRAGVDNVTDRRYWREAPTQPWGATYLFPAQPRTYRVGVTAQW